MAPKTVASWMLTRPWSSSLASLRSSSTAIELLVCRAVRLLPGGAERRAVDDPLHDQVDELVGAGQERRTRGGGQLKRLALELLDRRGLHDVVVGERGHGLDVLVGVAHHPVHPHGEQADGEQKSGKETGQRGDWRAEHRRDTSDRRAAPVRGCGRGLLVLHTSPMSTPAPLPADPVPPVPAVPYGGDVAPVDETTVSAPVTAQGVAKTVGRAALWVGIRALVVLIIRAAFRALARR